MFIISIKSRCSICSCACVCLCELQNKQNWTPTRTKCTSYTGKQPIATNHSVGVSVLFVFVQDSATCLRCAYMCSTHPHWIVEIVYLLSSWISCCEQGELNSRTHLNERFVHSLPHCPSLSFSLIAKEQDISFAWARSVQWIVSMRWYLLRKSTTYRLW